MKKILLFVACVLLSLTACDRFKKKDADTPAPTEKPTPKHNGHNAKNTLDWAGEYEGLLPCDHCEGIQTTIELNEDGTFSQVEKPQGLSDNPVLSTSGTFEWDESGHVITLSSEDGSVRKFKVAEDELQLLNEDGSAITGAPAAYSILSKVQPDPFLGDYVFGDEDKGFFQKMRIVKKGSGYRVMITSRGTAGRCNFKGDGKRAGAGISVDLGKVKTGLNSTMLISFSGGEAEVDVSDSDYSDDLGAFCGKGSSLAGYYMKQ